MDNKNNYKKGFSLIELVVVMALMGIVVTLVFNLYFYSHQTFYAEEKQYDVQSDVRIVTDYIVNKTRYAGNMEIINISSVDLSSTEYNYVYYNGTDTVNFHFVSDTDVTIGSHISSLNFSVSPSDNTIMKIIITAERDPNDYQSDVEYKLVNVELNEDIIETPDGLSNSSAIRFRNN